VGVAPGLEAGASPADAGQSAFAGLGQCASSPVLAGCTCVALAARERLTGAMKPFPIEFHRLQALLALPSGPRISLHISRQHSTDLIILY